MKTADPDQEVIKDTGSHPAIDAVITAWKGFVDSIAALPKEIDTGVLHLFVPDEVLDSVIVREQEKPPVLLSFRDHWAASEISNGIEKVVIAMAVTRADKTKTEVSKMRKQSIEIVSNYIASGKCHSITSPLAFWRACLVVLSESRLARLTGLRIAIEGAADNGTIVWDTNDGKSLSDRGQYDWDIHVPKQQIRLVWYWTDIMGASKRKSIILPTRFNLPTVARTGGDKWTITKGNETIRVTGASEEASEFGDLVGTSAWKVVTTECRENAVHNARESVYILVLKDASLPKEISWQVYAGSAKSGIAKRWFDTDSTSHLTTIRTIIGLSHVRDVSTSNPPRVILVDMALAAMWSVHATWNGLAYLFAAQSDLAVGTAQKTEAEIIQKWKLTYPRNGFNQR